mgnify:CR=1 FL=1
MPDDTPKDAATEMISDDLVAFADHLADTARDLALRCFRQQLEVEYKSDDTPVTTVDREIEQALRQQVADAYPAHSFIGEEFGPQDTESPWSWVVDPIDGTKSFITGKPTFGRSEEHTSELQSRTNLVCRLLLEKKKNKS